MLLAHDPQTQYNKLLRRIHDRGLADDIIVLDPVPRARLPGVLQAADCVVVPSISEGFGYSALEAAGLGLPVVATTGHSLDEVLEDATLVPPRDVSALAEAIVSVAKGDRKPARPRSRYDLAQQVRSTEAAYASLIDGLGSVRPDNRRARRGGMPEIKTHFNSSPQEYEATRSGHMQDRRAEFVSVVLDRIGGQARRVLEIGSATGGLLAELAARYPTDSFRGIDVEADMVAFAQKTHAGPNVDYAVEDVTVNPPVEPFDVVVSIDLIHHLHDHAAAFPGIRRLLRDGGVWIAMEPNIWNPYVTLQQERMRRAGFDEDHFRPWRLVPLLRDAGFKVERRRFVQAFPAAMKQVPPWLARIERVVERVPVLGGSAAYELTAV
jgi:SAM-dependent methyltransferase